MDLSGCGNCDPYQWPNHHIQRHISPIVSQRMQMGVALGPLHYAEGTYWVLVFMWLKFTGEFRGLGSAGRAPWCWYRAHLALPISMVHHVLPYTAESSLRVVTDSPKLLMMHKTLNNLQSSGGSSAWCLWRTGSSRRRT